MTLLGVPLPNLAGTQIAIDLFPELLKRKRSLSLPSFQEFLIVRLPMLEQRRLWEGFQRLLRMSEAECWDLALRDELIDLTFEAITPPRNRFLYKAQFWPLSDLIVDGQSPNFNNLFGTELDASAQGFLLRLCFSVYRIFEQLMSDLGLYSAVIKQQFDASRVLANSGLSVLDCYANFVAQVSPAGA